MVVADQIRPSRLPWHAKRVTAEAGIPFVALALVLAAAVVWQLVLLADRHTSLARLNEEIRLARTVMQQGPPVPTDHFATLPASKETSAMPRATSHELAIAVNRLANQHRVRLVRAEYSTIPIRESTWERIDATLALSGQYAQVKSFLAALLDALPSGAIEHLTVERADEKIGVRANLMVSVFQHSAE